MRIVLLLICVFCLSSCVHVDYAPGKAYMEHMHGYDA